jgi:predicted RNA-binding Zn-ribbon protein involved in translation (DUF1610 family)
MKPPDGYGWMDDPDPVKKALKVARHFLDISNIRPTQKVRLRAEYAIECIAKAEAALAAPEKPKEHAPPVPCPKCGSELGKCRDGSPCGACQANKPQCHWCGWEAKP